MLILGFIQPRIFLVSEGFSDVVEYYHKGANLMYARTLPTHPDVCVELSKLPDTIM